MNAKYVHGTLVPTINDSFSPMAADMIGATMMRGLECPFTWDNMIVFDDEDTKLMIDRLPVAVGVWDCIIQKCHLAFSEYQRGNIGRSNRFINECFIPLLPGSSCELTKIYRQGLKHVLDATSAFIRLHNAAEDSSRRLLYKFVENIEPLDSMPENQKAAISAIRSRVSQLAVSMLYARAAVALDPDEGHWHYYMTLLMYQIDLEGLKEENKPPEDIVAHSKMAMLSDKSPAPLCFMASLILKYSSGSFLMVRAMESVKKALDQFPNSPFVHEHAADIFTKCTPPMLGVETGNYRRIETHYKRALELAGKEIYTIRHKLGVIQFLTGIPELKREGIENLRKVRHFSIEAQIHYDSAIRGDLNSSALGCCISGYFPSVFGFDDDDDDDDEDDDVDSDNENCAKFNSTSFAPVKKSSKKSKKSSKKNKRRK